MVEHLLITENKHGFAGLDDNSTDRLTKSPSMNSEDDESSLLADTQENGDDETDAILLDDVERRSRLVASQPNNRSVDEEDLPDEKISAEKLRKKKQRQAMQQGVSDSTECQIFVPQTFPRALVVDLLLAEQWRHQTACVEETSLVHENRLEQAVVLRRSGLSHLFHVGQTRGLDSSFVDIEHTSASRSNEKSARDERQGRLVSSIVRRLTSIGELESKGFSRQGGRREKQ